MKGFVYLNLTLGILNENDEKCSKFYFERGLTFSFRITMESLAYPKSVMILLCALSYLQRYLKLKFMLCFILS